VSLALLLTIAIVVAFVVAAAWFGADSRDGEDWVRHSTSLGWQESRKQRRPNRTRKNELDRGHHEEETS
jgi:hypothetical protein